MFKFIASFFTVGFVPFAPGTFGALAALVFWYFMPTISLNLYILFLIIFILFSVWVSSKAIENKKSLKNDKKHNDPSWIVIDEAVGVLITIIPLYIYSFSWIKLLIAFILFRFFDILKPYPIKKIEKLPKGWGIIFDDVLAGIYAMLVLFILCINFNI